MGSHWATTNVFRAFDQALGRLSPASVMRITLVSLLSIFAILGLVLDASRNDATVTAQTSSQNLVAAVSQDIERNIDLLDLSLQAVRDGVSDPDIMALSPSLQRAIMFDRAATAPGLGDLLVIDETGRVSIDSNPSRVPTFNLSQEHYFRAHLDDSDPGLLISRPSISPLDGMWGIGLSRRVNHPDGRFAGVVVGTLKASYLKDLFGRLDLGRDGSVSLMGPDGSIFMRQPLPEKGLDHVVTIPLLKAAIDSAPEGMFDAVSSLDGVNRRFYFRHIGKLPLIAIVGRSIDEIYAPWRARALVTGAGIGLLGAVVLALLGRLQQELARRTAAEAELAVLARTDALTGIPNRRAFDAVLEREWRRARRTQSPMALLMLDVDHFKAFNDQCGHQAGDSVLADLAASVTGALRRPSDFLARYGGEEFAVLLPGADRDEAIGVAERLIRHVADLRRPHPKSPLGILSISIGAAAILPAPTGAASDLVSWADQALYLAKRLGRNRAVMADTAVTVAA